MAEQLGQEHRPVPAAAAAERDRQVALALAPVARQERQQQALDIAGLGGRINFFGGLSKADSVIQFDSNKVHYNELVVTGTTACSTYDCWRAAEIVNSGRLDLAPLITSRFPLGEAPAAFAAAADGKNLRVSLEP